MSIWFRDCIERIVYQFSYSVDLIDWWIMHSSVLRSAIVSN